MNRTLLLGIAVFLAIVGMSLYGGESTAVAGHGCCSCDCSCSCDACHCSAGYACHGGCYAGGGCHVSYVYMDAGCYAGYGYCDSPCSIVSWKCSGACGCWYGGPMVYHYPPAAPVDAATTMPPMSTQKLERKPFGFRQVSFRR